MKKTLSLILCALMLVGMLAACGNGGATTEAQSPAESSAAPQASSTGEKTEVVFWHSMSGAFGEAIDKIVADYNASQDEVHVTAEYQGNYYDMAAKLQTAVTSGDSPNLAQLEMVRVKMFSDYGILANISDAAVEAGLDTTQFFDGLMASCDWGAGLYGLPFNRSTPMFYYNKDMFAEVGLDPESPPTNWEELREYANKLSIADERWGFEVPIDAWFYEAFIMQSDCQLLNEDETDIAFNNDAGTAPLYLLREMIDEGSMKAPPGQEYNSYEAARSDFAAGITGMIITSSGDLGTLNTACDFEVGTAFLPGNTRYGVPTGGANVVALTGHDAEMAATMDFVKYLTSADVAGYWSSVTGYVPISQAAADSDVYQTFLNENENGKTAMAQMAYTDIPRPVNSNWSQIHTEIMMTEMQRCIEDRSYTPEEAVAAISEQAKALLAG